MYVKTLSPASVNSHAEDYSKILRIRSLKYKEVDKYYFQVGTIKNAQGWILHISVIKIQILQLLNIIVPLLTKEKVPFKIIQNSIMGANLLDGSFGYTLLGKIVSIYPNTDGQALALAQKMITITRDFRGPNIPTDAYLGGTVYTRYGSFTPLTLNHKNGQFEKYMHNHLGQLIKDSYLIPFQLPKGIKWPFKGINLEYNKVNKTLNNTYLITSTIKDDVKGMVFRGVQVKGLRIRRCIIKEAKHDIGVDLYERDVRERLRWQYKILDELSAHIPMPKAYSLFDENGNLYMAMEFIEGTPLYKIIDKEYQNASWEQMGIRRRIAFLDYLMQLLNNIEKLHKRGYVHRDITQANFIVNKQNKLVMIDLEGAYSVFEEKPHPAFNIGTPGFTSPEQRNNDTPTFKEDIYGLGALMIVFFTGIRPSKFNPTNLKLDEKLDLFIEKRSIIELIIQCMNIDSKVRPTLDTVKDVVRTYRIDLEQQLPRKAASPKEIDHDQLISIVSKGILALNSPIMTDASRIWHTNMAEDEYIKANKQHGKTYEIGIYAGISGVLYALACAKNADISISKISSVYTHNFKYLERNVLAKLPNVLPGLYYGSSGVALLLAEATKSEMINATTEIKTKIERCFDTCSSTLNIESGISGQGLSVLKCMPYLKPERAEALLQKYVQILIDGQLSDGSWVNEKNDKIKWRGFSKGVAGITIFLLEYYKYFKNSQVQEAISKSLNWLTKTSIKANGKTFWTISNIDKTPTPWLNSGSVGIALCFIRAYEAFKNPFDKQMAEKALEYLPKNLTHNNLGLAEGISGVGEVCLEGYRTFKSEECLGRAEWIANVLMRTIYDNRDGTCHWIVENNKNPSADFMVGNSGVIHFLMRYYSPGKLNFPLF